MVIGQLPRLEGIGVFVFAAIRRNTFRIERPPLVNGLPRIVSPLSDHRAHGPTEVVRLHVFAPEIELGGVVNIRNCLVDLLECIGNAFFEREAHFGLHLREVPGFSGPNSDPRDAFKDWSIKQVRCGVGQHEVHIAEDVRSSLYFIRPNRPLDLGR